MRVAHSVEASSRKESTLRVVSFVANRLLIVVRSGRVLGFAAGCEAPALPRRAERMNPGLRPWCGLCPSLAAVANKLDLCPPAAAHPRLGNPAIFEHWTICSRLLGPPHRRVPG